MAFVRTITVGRRFELMELAHAISKQMQEVTERTERARAEFNFRSIRNHIPRGARVLDVGAWSCYLGELLRDRLDCDVLSLDVVDVNKTGVPFQVFDGKTLPVESASFDCVLLLYVLHHASDDEPLLREAQRVLRDGGRLLVAEDSVETIWNRMITIGFHVWLWLVTRMGCSGTFRTSKQWIGRFSMAGFQPREIQDLGHHLNRSAWPKNILFSLEKRA